MFNILLQVLDDGRLTDNKGRTVNFRNTIIIMTSNLGSSIIRENLSDLEGKDKDRLFEETRRQVFDLLKQTIRPEFLNRIDEIIMFRPLDESQIMKIVGLQFDQVRKMLKDNGIDLRIKDAAIEWIAEKGFDPQYGARPVKRMLQKYVVNELSKQILSDSVNRDKPIVIDVRDGQLVFTN